MTSILQKEILKLSRDQRLALVKYIIDSIQSEEGKESGDISETLEAELKKRSESLRNGTAEFTTWEEIKSSLMDSNG